MCARNTPSRTSHGGNTGSNPVGDARPFRTANLAPIEGLARFDMMQSAAKLDLTSCNVEPIHSCVAIDGGCEGHQAGATMDVNLLPVDAEACE